MTERQKYHERLLPRVEDPLAVVTRLAAAHPDQDYVCYESPVGWSFAAGTVAELRMSRARTLLRTPQGETEYGALRHPLRAIPRLLDSLPITEWRCYGWVGYDIAVAEAGLDELVADGELLHLVVPGVEVRLHASGTLLRALDPDDLDAVEKLLVAADPEPAQVPVPVALDGVGADAYRTAVSRAVEDIKGGRLQKVVLSRTVEVASPVDMVGTYAMARRANTPARSFLFSLDGLAATGVSPETVAVVTDEGVVTTQPLAGTRARTGDGARDAELRTELLGDSKEIFEHAISVKVAYDELVDLCGPGSVEVPEFMVVRERGTVQHLASAVRGRLGEGKGPWDAFAALFPAVTASGVPKKVAYEVIGELESAERGPYSGAVLVHDADGSLDAALVLRTVFQQGGRTWLRAGAGVVEQSCPEREFTETCEKLSSVARYLVPGASARRTEG